MRCTSQTLLQAVNGLLDVALLLAGAPAEPVCAAQLVEHGPPDALGGKGLDLHALRRVEAAERIGQANHAHLDQVIDLDVGGQLGHHLVRQSTHQRAVLAQHGVDVETPFG